jgi:predicted esterase
MTREDREHEIADHVATSMRSFHGSTVQLVHGSKDNLVPEQVWRENEERLNQANVKAQAHSFPGGHAIDPVILARCMEQVG